MPKTTAERLAEYEAAETKILKAQEVRGGDIQHRRAELADVRQAIKELTAQLARESRSTGGPRFSVANLNRGN